MTDAAERAAARRALELYEELLGRSPEARAELRQRLAEDQPRVAEVLDRLLSADLDAWPTEVSLRPAAAAPLAPPERLGVYRLTGPLGHGGMGEVHRAVRDDGLFDQAVAIKIVRAAVPGAAVAAKFAEERRILARLRHPQIASILDGGTTPDGRPYLVMELVDGVPLDTYLKDTPCSLAELAGIVIATCRAVQYAHQQLVVHADLKPSNVLVGATGLVKLVDFGIAAIIGAERPAAAEAEPPVAVTQAFASPERLASGLPSVADDIHALGVTLAVALHVQGARAPCPVDEQLAWVLQDAPLPADLVAIVRRATAASAAARYATAAELADDLERWRTGLAVLAMGGRRSYRAGRFVARHRIAVAAVASAALSVVVALAVTSVQYLRAERARAEAEQRFTDVSSMGHFMLYDLFETLRRTPGTLRAREQVLAVGQRYIERLAQAHDAPVDVRLDAIRGYDRLGEVWAAPYAPNLGDHARALEDLDRARQLSAQLLAAHPELAAARIEFVHTAIMSVTLRSVAEGPDAVTQAQLSEARRVLDGAGPQDQRTSGWRLADADWWTATATIDSWQGRYRQAIDAADHALAVLERLPVAADDAAGAATTRARALDARAEAVYYDRGPLAAVPDYEALLESAERDLAASPLDPDAQSRLMNARYGLGTTLISAGRSAEGILVLKPALEVIRAEIARDPDDFNALREDSVFVAAYAQALMAIGRTAESLAAGEQVVRDRTRFLAREPGDFMARRDYQTALVILGDLYASAHQPQAACARYREARAFIEQAPSQRPLNAHDRQTNLAGALAGIGKTCNDPGSVRTP